MDLPSVERLRRLIHLSSYFGPQNLTSEAHIRLAIACHDRAILLPEVSDSVLKGKFGFQDTDLQKIRRVQASIVYDLIREREVEGLFLPTPTTTQSEFPTFARYADSLVPDGWSHLEYCTASRFCSGWQLARAIEDVFKEDASVQRSQDVHVRTPLAGGLGTLNPDKVKQRFADKVLSSGFASLESSVTLIQTNPKKTTGMRAYRLPPQKRIRSNVVDYEERKDEIQNTIQWRSNGQLFLQSQFRTTLKSVLNSWESIRWAINTWALFMQVHSPLTPHFPVLTHFCAVYCTILDNSGTMSKYIQHLRTAHRLLRLPDFYNSEVREFTRGAKKLATEVSPKRCFIVQDKLNSMIADLERTSETLLDHAILIDLIVIGYHYQLRVSELFALAFDNRTVSPFSWCFITIDRNSVSINLSGRKNRTTECKITRSCWCGPTPKLCGACRIRKLSRNRKSKSEFFFPQSRTRFTKLLKAFGVRAGIPNACWHGLRRGRTVDLMRLRDQHGRPLVSLAEVFESGQWAEGSRALLSYVQESDLDARRFVVMCIDNSDSDE